ncbi:MAG: redoxin family protein [Alphaproteobacteria bacterium]|nr:redoxin family protein [Alphaproteobacteria bacterium]
MREAVLLDMRGRIDKAGLDAAGRDERDGDDAKKQDCCFYVHLGLYKPFHLSMEGIIMLTKPQMRSAVFALFFLVVMLAAAQVQARLTGDRENGTAVKAATILPEAIFTNIKGEDTSLAAWRGEVVLVNLWATWCPPCVAELASLETLGRKMKDHGFKVVAISMDRKKSAEEVKAFLEEKGIMYLDVYMDSRRDIAKKWSYEGLPVSFLLDRNGMIVSRFEGPRVWDEGKTLAQVAQVVGVSVPTP